MLKYIWINPVVAKMYASANIPLDAQLKEKGFLVVAGNPELAGVVKDKFVSACQQSTQPVLDTRCPLAISASKAQLNLEAYTIPDIHPILIHTAFDLYERYEIGETQNELHIVCPCTDLSHLGNQIAQSENKAQIYFYSWKDFAAQHGIELCSPVGCSPIPLGFFDQTELNVQKLTEGDEIIKELSNPNRFIEEKVHLVEMLWCKEGCHNGDGVR